jgi:hypothetical protein
VVLTAVVEVVDDEAAAVVELLEVWAGPPFAEPVVVVVAGAGAAVAEPVNAVACDVIADELCSTADAPAIRAGPGI